MIIKGNHNSQLSILNSLTLNSLTLNSLTLNSLTLNSQLSIL